MAKEAAALLRLARGGSRRHGQGHWRATKKLTKEIQVTAPLLPARFPWILGDFSLLTPISTSLPFAEIIRGSNVTLGVTFEPQTSREQTLQLSRQ